MERLQPTASLAADAALTAHADARANAPKTNNADALMVNVEQQSEDSVDAAKQGVNPLL